MKIIVISALLFLNALFANSQAMRVWSNNGYSTVSLDVVDSVTFITQEEFEKQQELERTLGSCFYAFRSSLGRRFDEGNSMNSDEYIAESFSGDYYNEGDCAGFCLHKIDPDHSKNQLNVYNEIISGITLCNKAISGLGGENISNTAGLRAVRAFYHFLLMDQWGDTPILDHVLANNESIERSPRADVAKWIESELLTCRDNCTTIVDESTYGRPTRWMVDALLSKLYLNWPVYANDITSSSWTYGTNPKLNDCIDVCDDIINSGLFALAGGDENAKGENDYKMKFFYTNGYKVKDFIYAMPFDASSQQGLTYARFRTWRRGQNNNGFYSIEMTNSVGGNFALTPEFVLLFSLQGDRRNDCIAGDATQETTDIYQYDNSTGEKTDIRNSYKGTDVTFTRSITLGADNPAGLDCGADMTGWTQGYRSIKFFPNVTEYNAKSRNQSNDVPIFRYADILLMKAEALVRGGKATSSGVMGCDDALSLFNQIRSYAGAPLINETPSLQDIEDERGREFLDEHWRRNDLIRMGHFERDWGFKKQYGSNDPQMRLWPLSVDVLSTYTNWKQNAGY